MRLIVYVIIYTYMYDQNLRKRLSDCHLGGLIQIHMYSALNTIVVENKRDVNICSMSKVFCVCASRITRRVLEGDTDLYLILDIL